ncbi:MAG: sigma-54 dependent transcriptional regulator, partial [Lentilitoribacter sp.]
KRRLTLEVRSLRNNLNHQQILKTNLNGKSAVIQSVRDQISALANLQTDILISGETGTGKGTAARLLHELSARQHGPFAHINCATIPKDLVEIELFGHEAGAFPSATHSRYGKFEHARGGTIFLDSIEALSQEIQGKLLQAINDRIITKLGSNSPIELDVRFIASSQKDLKVLIEKGLFRSDLYYCLTGASIKMPSLRDRKEDIPQLFNEFAKLSSLRHKVQTPFIPSSLYMQLSSSDWPGNLHELQRIVDRFVLNLDLDLSSTDIDFKEGMSLNDLLANQERAIIASALTANEGSLKNTYESLKISRKALYEKMLKFNLRREDFSTDE